MPHTGRGDDCENVFAWSNSKPAFSERQRQVHSFNERDLGSSQHQTLLLLRDVPE